MCLWHVQWSSALFFFSDGLEAAGCMHFHCPHGSVLRTWPSHSCARVSGVRQGTAVRGTGRGPSVGMRPWPWQWRNSGWAARSEMKSCEAAAANAAARVCCGGIQD